MKAIPSMRPMTCGEFIARVYEDCGERRASGIVRFVLKAHLVGFRRPFRFVVPSRRLGQEKLPQETPAPTEGLAAFASLREHTRRFGGQP